MSTNPLPVPWALLLCGVASLALPAAPCRAGAILNASCPCGFSAPHLFVGGGRANFKTVCRAPAHCPACKKIRLLNWLLPNPRCTDCGGKTVFYNDPSLREKPRAANDAPPRTIFTWNTGKKGVFALTDARHLCPACGKMTLIFRQGGRWD